ncbi:ATP-binding protein [Lapidilactobacillus luobeiensis]|uniref:ATP-binding protein n=1 Tax=Lapidilactobacillus luobeiensis TaxID=2950371 RepID=UPI0021C4B5B3|nr:ATP-binding protein [Lapidilactobacillus luobeiensis]
MSLLVLIGAQAVGKMTVGEALSQEIDGRLLFNHQTIDLFANFLGYDERTFALSDRTRKELFRAFVAKPEANLVETIIFTIMIDFSGEADRDFLTEISDIFLAAGQSVYFVELQADLETRLQRNQSDHRLQKKPSKRDRQASEQELRQSMSTYRLLSRPGELAKLFPQVATMVLDNTDLTAPVAAAKIRTYFELPKRKK